MSEPFVGEIKIFAGSFAPRNYAFCNGQLLPISQNTALFSIVGTTYGGDGETSLGLPDLRGRAPMHPGRGPGLTSRFLGEKVGSETASLTLQQMPVHNHTPQGFPNTETANPTVDRGLGSALLYATPGALVDMAPGMIGETGSPTPAQHPNVQPRLSLTFIIALIGVFPSI